MSDWLLRTSRTVARCWHLCTTTALGLATVFLGMVAVAPSALAASFADVATDHPQAAAIDYLTTDGIISGYPDGSFRPAVEVNRAEALKILLLGSGISQFAAASDAFPDVPADAWFADFVAEAVAREVVGGYPDGSFRPAQTVNLVEALKMLLAVNRVDLSYYPANAISYADAEAGAWYVPYLYYAQVFGLVDADERNNVAPSTPLTRAQLADLMYRFATRLDTVCPRVFENTQHTRTNYFAGITLDAPLPNLFFAGEVFPLRGRTTVEAEEVTVFFTDVTGTQRQFAGDVAPDGSFEVPVFFATPGFVQFAVIAGTSGENVAKAVQIAPPTCQPAIVDIDTAPATDLAITTANNQPTITWAAPENTLARVVLRQGDRRTERLVSGGQTSLVLDPARFIGWAADEASVQISLATNEGGVTSEPRTRWSVPTIQTVDVVEHHFSTVRDDLALTSIPTVHTGSGIQLTGSASTALRAQAATITPTGDVIFTEITPGDTLSAGTPFDLTIPTTTAGTYIVELNDVSGLAVLNHPVYPADTLPLVPDFTARTGDDVAMSNSINREKALWIREVHAARTAAGLPSVLLDTALGDLAQQYADYLVAHDHFGHTDLSGRGPDDRRREAGIPLPVGENLAQSSSTSSAHAGLMRSAIHRANILDPDWNMVGLGIAQGDNGSYSFVQEFGSAVLDSDGLAARADELLDMILDRVDADYRADTLLTDVAQDWSAVLAETGTLAFESLDSSLETEIRATGYRGSFSSLLSSAGDLDTIADSIATDMQGDTGFSYIAAGLAQGDNGAYVVTVILR